MRLHPAAFAVLLLLTVGCTPAVVPTNADPEITLAFVGDILLGGGLEGIIAYRGVDYPWAHAAPILRRADLAMGNLETAVSRRGSPSAGKQFTFRSRPETLAGARRAGIDLLTLANNHTLDWGGEALLDTIQHVRKAGMEPVGAGRDTAEAFTPAILEAEGLKVAVLGFTRVIPFPSWVAGQNRPGLAAGWEPKPVLEAVADASTRADVVVVLFHWGEEVKDHPRSTDVDLAHRLLNVGATVVVGHHAHVLQGMELRGGGLVAYSLGNFIFTSSGRPLARETGILEVKVKRTGVTGARFTPLSIRQGQPGPVDARTAQRIRERLDRLSLRWNTRVGSDFTITEAASR